MAFLRPGFIIPEDLKADEAETEQKHEKPVPEEAKMQHDTLTGTRIVKNPRENCIYIEEKMP